MGAKDAIFCLQMTTVYIWVLSPYLVGYIAQLFG